MKIKSLHIKNFKSIVDLTINEPNPFTVFVGPNGSGKSNIFEALEFAKHSIDVSKDLLYSIFGGENIFNRNIDKRVFDFYFEIDTNKYFEISLRGLENNLFETGGSGIYSQRLSEKYETNFAESFSRIFVNNKQSEKVPAKADNRLSTSCDNLEKVLKRILQNPVLREEILDYLTMLVPELENIEIITDEIDGDSKLRIYEKFSKKPFNKALISDGTYNILCLLAAVYQSEEPQFLCIEEPENGLSPYAIEMLVGLFRTHCQDYGHYIWLNTHSQTLVRNLKPEEFILVDKIQGETKIKQYKAGDLEGWSMDEAWLTNALGGGLPW